MVVRVYSTSSTNHDILPEYTAFPVYAPNLKIFVSVGAYILLRGADVDNELLRNANGHIVAQILSFNKISNCLKCRVLSLITQVLPLVGLAADADGNEIDIIRTGIAGGIPEVVTACYQVVATPLDIIDVSFVFNIMDFVHGRVYGHGIINCFLLRYKYTSNNSLVSLPYQPIFPSDNIGHLFFDRCSNAVLWYSISSLQDAIWKGLNRRADRQDNFIRIPFHFDDILKTYILYRTQGIVNPIVVTAGLIRCFTLKGLDRETFRAPNLIKLVRFQTNNQLQCLRSIVGNAVTIGQRVRRPRLFEREELRPQTVVHVILGRNEDVPVHLRRGDRSSRIDFVFSDYHSYVLIYFDDYQLSIDADELVNDQNEDIMENEFIQFMIATDFD